MRRSQRWLFVVAALVVLSLNGAALNPPPAGAGMICHDGTWRASDMHCQLGSNGGCTECWVWAK